MEHFLKFSIHLEKLKPLLYSEIFEIILLLLLLFVVYKKIN